MNRKVSQVWLVVLFSSVMIVTIIYYTFQAVDEIEANTYRIVSTGIELR